MSAYEWEGVARWLGEGGPMAVTRRHGVRVIRRHSMPTFGALGWLNEEPIISVHWRAPEPNFTLGHELGHLGMRLCGVPDSEEGADYIAAALLMPRIGFCARLHEVGVDPTQLALPFGVTETAACLRLAEIDGRPLVVVAPRRVRVRGPEEWVWPHESALRSANALPGLAKVRLKDDRRRFALVG